MCGVGGDKVSITDSVGDLITKEDSIRFLRGTPSEQYGGECGLTSEVRYCTWNYYTLYQLVNICNEHAYYLQKLRQ